MDADVADLARRAAEDLVQLDPDIQPRLEAEIAAYGRDDRLKRFEPGTTIALAGLALTVAQFVYQIRRDRKADTRLAPDALRRRVRLELDERGYPDTGQRSAVIDAVIKAVSEAQA